MTTLLIAEMLLVLSGLSVQLAEVKARYLDETSTTFNELPFILQKVAICESKGRQSARGPLKEIGIFQIRPEVWGKKAKDLGFDIYEASGNMGMAVWIYENYGWKPWLASKRCWSK